MNDPLAAAFYLDQAGQIAAKLDDFWLADEGFITATLDAASFGRSGVDAAVLLAVLHAGGKAGEPWSVVDERVLATLVKYVDAFRGDLYAVNEGGRGRKEWRGAVAVGRYAEDVYDGDGKSAGNPWFLTTFAVAELQYRCVRIAQARNSPCTKLTIRCPRCPSQRRHPLPDDRQDRGQRRLAPLLAVVRSLARARRRPGSSGRPLQRPAAQPHVQRPGLPARRQNVRGSGRHADRAVQPVRPGRRDDQSRPSREADPPTIARAPFTGSTARRPALATSPGATRPLSTRPTPGARSTSSGAARQPEPSALTRASFSMPSFPSCNPHTEPCRLLLSIHPPARPHALLPGCPVCPPLPSRPPVPLDALVAALPRPPPARWFYDAYLQLPPALDKGDGRREPRARRPRPLARPAEADAAVPPV